MVAVLGRMEMSLLLHFSHCVTFKGLKPLLIYFFKCLSTLKAKINLLACKGGLKGWQTPMQVHPSLHDVTLLWKSANCQCIHGGNTPKLIFICNLLSRKVLTNLLFSFHPEQWWPQSRTGEISRQTSLKKRIFFFCSSWFIEVFERFMAKGALPSHIYISCLWQTIPLFVPEYAMYFSSVLKRGFTLGDDKSIWN